MDPKMQPFHYIHFQQLSASISLFSKQCPLLEPRLADPIGGYGSSPDKNSQQPFHIRLLKQEHRQKNAHEF